MEEEPLQDDKKSVKSMEGAIMEPSISSDDVCDGRARVSGQEEFTCSLYISRAVSPQGQVQRTQGGELLHSNLEEVIRASDPSAGWHVSETPCGLIAAFKRETDAEKLLQRGDLARVFQGPIQVLDAGHYELLLRQGLDFFGAARFTAVPERWWRGGTGNVGGPLQTGLGIVNNLFEASNFQTGDSVLQCYRCQGFWHMAANCRHLPRCVRCGEPHSVEFCPRPRNNPICCHCSGPHHAGTMPLCYRQCPVRQQLSNATPISITLSTTRIGNQYPVNGASKTTASSHEQQPLKSS
nr:PREDICTED: uncharacterized protein LOC100878286 isoform X3 [Megachile rotundata]